MKPEERFARQLCRVLDQGTRDLDHSITERLRAGRERALQQQVATAEAFTIVGAGGTAVSFGGDRHPLRTMFAILALLLGVSLAYYWNGFNQANENEEIDSALLADDLPPNAYLDRGFQAWIEKSPASAASPVATE
jgi:predicted metal-dependent phosphoesterase TrpH